MKRYLSLLRVNLMVGLDQLFQMNNKKKKKRGIFAKLGSVGMLLFLAVLFTPMFISFGLSGYNGMLLFRNFGLDKLLPSVMIFMGVILTLFMGFSIVPSLYFFSNDTETYLAMPISPRELMSVKFVTALIEQLYLVVLFQLPMVIGFLVADFSIQAMFGWLLTLLFVPTLSTLVVSVIIILMMQIVPKLRNKQTMTMFTGLITIIFAVGIGMGSSFMSSDGGESLAQMLLNSGMMFEGIDKFYPPAAAARMMVFGNGMDFFIGLVMLIGFSLLLMAIFVFLVQKMYLRVALSLGGNSGKAKVLDADGRSRAIGRKKSVFKAMLGREMKSLLRTPAYFLNSIVPALIFPIMFIGMGILGFVRGGGELQLDTIKSFVEFFLANDLTKQLMFGLGIGGGLGFLSTGNGVSATAISRDAKHLDFLKTIPYSGSRILFVKMLAGMLLSLPMFIALVVGTCIVVPFMPVLYLSLFGGMLIVVYTINAMELLLDLKHPHLSWTDELKAVKGNINLMVSVFLSMGAGVAILLLIVLAEADPFIVITTAAGVLLVLGVLLTALFIRRGNRLLKAVGDR